MRFTGTVLYVTCEESGINSFTVVVACLLLLPRDGTVVDKWGVWVEVGCMSIV